MCKSLLIVLSLTMVLAACNNKVDVKSPSTPVKQEKLVLAPTPPKPEGGEQSPPLSPEALKAFRTPR